MITQAIYLEAPIISDFSREYRAGGQQSPRGWMIGFSEQGAAHNRILLQCLFFPEVHEELTKSWMAPFTARSRSSVSSILTTLDGGAARVYAGIPQVERAVAVHLCPWNTATWRNCPCLPSKTCKLTPALAAASALHAMAILQVHQAKVLKQMHEGSTDPGLLLYEQRKSLAVPLAQPGRDEGRRQGTLSRRPHLPGGLSCSATPSRALPSSSRRYSSRQRRSSTSCPGVMHHPPLPPGPGLRLPVAVGALLHPPELLRPRLNRHLGRRVEPLAGEWCPPRPIQPPSRPKSQQSGPDAGNPEILEFAPSQEMARIANILFPGGGPGGESCVSFYFWYPLFHRKSKFLFLRVLRSMWRQCAMRCFLTLAHDPSCQQPRERGSGTQYLPTHL